MIGSWLLLILFVRAESATTPVGRFDLPGGDDVLWREVEDLHRTRLAEPTPETAVNRAAPSRARISSRPASRDGWRHTSGAHLHH
ncbi:MAG: hypothetical protein ACREIA_07920 [Opitutaceae bacterium]